MRISENKDAGQVTLTMTKDEAADLGLMAGLGFADYAEMHRDEREHQREMVHSLYCFTHGHAQPSR